MSRERIDMEWRHKDPVIWKTVRHRNWFHMSILLSLYKEKVHISPVVQLQIMARIHTRLSGARGPNAWFPFHENNTNSNEKSLERENYTLCKGCNQTFDVRITVKSTFLGIASILQIITFHFSYKVKLARGLQRTLCANGVNRTRTMQQF